MCPPDQSAPEKRRVTIAGGGIAGLTAALYLARAGCAVTLYEEKLMLGGNLATRDLQRLGHPQGAQLDVYPHMFQGWYHNFWRLMEDVKVEREKSFAPFSSVHQLRAGEFPEVSTLTNPYSPRYLLKNLASGVAAPTDLFLFGCASLDLLAEVKDPTVRLENMSLTGYLNTRLYMTQAAIEAYETFISRVWAIPAYQISASDCRTYSAYCYAAGEEDCSLTTAPASQAFIDKIEAALDAAEVTIVPCTRIEQVVLDAGRVSEIVVAGTKFDTDEYEWVPDPERPPVAEPVEDLLLALPPTVLATLVRAGKKGQRIVDALPQLAELRRVGSQQVPMLHVYFNDRVENIPADPVGLAGSTLNLAFTDISQSWTEVRQPRDRTVLAVSCSEPYMLPGSSSEYDDGFAILEELRKYVPFELGSKWGESSEIDWELSRYDANADSQIAINAAGSDQWRPPAHFEDVENLFFAGACCRNEFGITTIEAAVATGLAAVEEVATLHGLGEVPEIIRPEKLPGEDYVVLRYAWLPAAYAAKALAIAEGCERGERRAPAQKESMLRYLLTPGLPARRGPGD